MLFFSSRSFLVFLSVSLLLSRGYEGFGKIFVFFDVSLPSSKELGVPTPGCFKPGCLQILRYFAPFLRSFADLRLRFIALICVFLQTTAFRTTAFGNSRKKQLGYAEVSKRGWRTQRVGTKKSFPCQRLRIFFCTLFPNPFRRRGDTFLESLFGGFEGLLIANPLPPTPFRNLCNMQRLVAPVQKRVWVVQKTLGRPLLPGPKKSQEDLLHPPLTTFGDFPFLGNFPGPQHPNSSVIFWVFCGQFSKGDKRALFKRALC